MSNNYVLNQEVFNKAVEEYKKELPNTHPQEIFKWKAVQWFQDHWNIDAENFYAMLDKSLEKTSSLLAANMFFPRKMILLFAEKEPELVRNMFKKLFDESLPLLERATNFEDNSKGILKKHFVDFKKDDQNFNTISIYLWLRYPNKYYVYKAGIYTLVANKLFNLNKSELPKGNKKRYEELIHCIELYDVLSEVLSKDTELVQASNEYLVDGCYRDEHHHILTVDFVFFLAQQNKNIPEDSTFLFTWKSENWAWDTFDKDREELFKNSSVTHRWGCSSHKKIKKDDRFYLIKLGHKPNGIFASGIINSEPYKDKHWNGSDEDIFFVDLKFDVLLDPQTNILSLDELKNINPEKPFRWTPQNTGIEIYEPYLSELNELWLNLIENQQSDNDDMEKFDIRMPINQILYGPPGTGKTYKIQQIAKNYIDIEFNEKSYLVDIVKNLTWIDVIIYAFLDIKDSHKITDILNNRFYLAKLNGKKVNWGHIYNELVAHSVLDPQLMDCKDYVSMTSIKRREPLIFDRNMNNEWFIVDSEKEKIVEYIAEYNRITQQINNPSSLSKTNSQNRYEIVTFHQSFSYEDFVEGIRAETTEDQKIKYEVKSGVFKEICEKAEKSPEKRFAIFIDEINRGNISNIFGELITLIEPDKRQGSKNELSITLPYSKTLFSVPKNLDIYGTMNTSDHSLTKLDLALRRRFEFVELLPNYGLLNDIDVHNVNIGEILKIMNDRIEVLLGRDYLIGHSYFLPLKDSDNKEQAFSDIFKNKIIPLLQEYFFEDWERIQWVLNDQNKVSNFQFIHMAKDNKDVERLFKKVEGLSIIDRRYQINNGENDRPNAFNQAEAYQQIIQTKEAE